MQHSLHTEVHWEVLSREKHLGGSGGSIIWQRRKVSCDAIATEALVPTGSSRAGIALQSFPN